MKELLLFLHAMVLIFSIMVFIGILLRYYLYNTGDRKVFKRYLYESVRGREGMIIFPWIFCLGLAFGTWKAYNIFHALPYTIIMISWLSIIDLEENEYEGMIKRCN